MIARWTAAITDTWQLTTPMARDLTSPASLYAKAVLFLLLGTLASTLLLLEHFSLRNLALLLLAIWAFCRAYYFIFYVIQHYIDPDFRYAGLWHFLRTRVLNSRKPPVD